MRISKMLLIILTVNFLIILISGCVSPIRKDGKPAPSQLAPTIKITNVSWDSYHEIIEITLNKFPSWDTWKLYIDGEEIPMEGGVGNPVTRPNGPVGQPQTTGLIIGTTPWVTGLGEVNFPCCGTIQFGIPGEGLTNEYEFNLMDFGCQTASKKECASD